MTFSVISSLCDSLRVIHMKIPLRLIPHQIWLVQILKSLYFGVEENCPGFSTDRIGHFILLFKNNCFMFPY